MKKTKKVILTFLFIVLCALYGAAIWFGGELTYTFAEMSIDSLFKKNAPFQKHYLDKWDITIPENAKLEFKFSLEGGFPKDGEYYTIIKFESRPDELLQSFSNEITSKDLSSYQKAMERLIEHGMDESKVVYPEENFLVDVKDDGFIDKIIILYDENKNIMYMWEWLP